MILPGHIAISLLCHKLLRADLPTVMAATLVPDAVDKTLGNVLHLAPSGRYAMHSLLGWAAASCLAGWLGGNRRGYAWALGHLAHFMGDGGRIPWWLPFKRYEVEDEAELGEFLWTLLSTTEGRRSLIAEMLLLILALASPSRDRRIQ